MCFAFSKLLCCSAVAVQGPAHRLPAFPADCSKCLIVGQPTSQLSSLALQFATNTVIESGDPQASALVVAHKPALEEHAPVLAAGLGVQGQALTQVKIRYLTCHSTVQDYLSCLHMLIPAPTAIVLHNISSLPLAEPGKQSTESRDVQLSKTLACLVNAAECIRTPSGGPLPILVTDDGSGLQEVWHLLTRWLPLVLEVKGSPAGLCLSVHPQCSVIKTLPEALQSGQIHYKLTDTMDVQY